MIKRLLQEIRLHSKCKKRKPIGSLRKIAFDDTRQEGLEPSSIA